MRNFPIDPHFKNRTLWQRHVYEHDVVKMCDFYNGGLWGQTYMKYTVGTKDGEMLQISIR